MLRKSGWKDRLLVRFGRLKPFRVEGSSMRPTLTENEIVLVRLGSAASAGDIVLAQHPYKRSVKILKRVKSVFRRTGVLRSQATIFCKAPTVAHLAVFR